MNEIWNVFMVVIFFVLVSVFVSIFLSPLTFINIMQRIIKSFEQLHDEDIDIFYEVNDTAVQCWFVSIFVFVFLFVFVFVSVFACVSITNGIDISDEVNDTAVQCRLGVSEAIISDATGASPLYLYLYYLFVFWSLDVLFCISNWATSGAGRWCFRRFGGRWSLSVFYGNSPPRSAKKLSGQETASLSQLCIHMYLCLGSIVFVFILIFICVSNRVLLVIHLNCL